VKRILFVDDEQNILDGLRDLLRKYRREMDIVFAQGSAAALDELRAGPFDVIVSDMRMPGMDGAMLLQRVKEEYPDVARIILSGHADREAIFKAVQVSHQFLSKPCDADRLYNVIERACQLRSLLTDESLRKLVGNIEKLPSLPSVYYELMGVMARPDASVQTIAGIVEQDPAMSTKILQLVNSACFGTTTQFARIDRAVVYLGTELIKNLALVAHVFGTLMKCSAASKLSFENQQRHAILTARVARRFFPDAQSSQYAFTAGLLHDIGNLILAVSIPDRFAAVRTACSTADRPSLEIELNMLGVTHTQVGAYLLGLWGLPYQIVEAVAYHHSADTVPSQIFDIPTATWLADALVNQQMGEPGEINPDHLERLNVISHLPRWTAIAHEEVELSRKGNLLC
jgi:HD-like signal output (HDOD) protein